MVTFFSQRFQNLVVACNATMLIFKDHFLFLNETKSFEIKFLRERIEYHRERNIECNFREISSKSIKNTTNKLNILVQRMGGLGDILFCTPIIKYVKSLGHNVDFYLHHGYWQALVLNPDVNKIYCSKDYIKNTKTLPIYDTFPIEAKPELFANYDKVMTFQGAIEHNKNAEIDHVIDAYYKWVDIDPFDKPKEITLNLHPDEIESAKKYLFEKGYDPHKPFVGISPTASFARNRSWPIQYVRKLKHLLDKDFNVVLIDRGERIDDCMGWTLRHMFSIVENLDLLVTVDTGVLHVAGALNVPTLALFGSFNPDLRCRYYKNCEVICHNKESCGQFCFNHSDYCQHIKNRLTVNERAVKTNWCGVYPPCLTAIKPEEVVKKVYEKIEKECLV